VDFIKKKITNDYKNGLTKEQLTKYIEHEKKIIYDITKDLFEEKDKIEFYRQN